jgi:hypothetical protein
MASSTALNKPLKFRKNVQFRNELPSSSGSETAFRKDSRRPVRV